MAQRSNFGDLIKLPGEYRSFWREYQKSISGKEGIEDQNQGYFSRRVNSLLPGKVGEVDRGDTNKLVLSRVLKEVPVIQQTVPYRYAEDTSERYQPTHLTSRETVISLSPRIETALFANEIRRYRRVVPKLESTWGNYNWLNGDHFGNPNLVGLLFDLFEEYQTGLSEEGDLNYTIEGNEMMVTPSSHPIERDVARFYKKIGRERFDALTKEQLRLQGILEDARSVDASSVTGLEEEVNTRFSDMRKDLLINV